MLMQPQKARAQSLVRERQGGTGGFSSGAKLQTSYYLHHTSRTYIRCNDSENYYLIWGPIVQLASLEKNKSEMPSPCQNCKWLYALYSQLGDVENTVHHVGRTG